MMRTARAVVQPTGLGDQSVAAAGPRVPLVLARDGFVKNDNSHARPWAPGCTRCAAWMMTHTPQKATNVQASEDGGTYISRVLSSKFWRVFLWRQE